MRRFLKYSAILVGIVVVLLVLAAVALATLIDPNRYRDDIVQAVKAQTGRDLKIEGDLSLSFYPWLGLETGRLVLANAKGFGPEPFAVVGSSETRVELLPLLRQRVVVDAVRLEGLQLNLARKADGRTNWEDLAAAGGKPGEPAPDGGGGGTEALALFTIERVELGDAAFTWKDEAAGATYAARNVALTSEDLLGESPGRLQLGFDLEGTKPAIKRRVELDARLHFDPRTQVLDAPQLHLAVGELDLRGRVRAEDLARAPKLKGSIEVPAFDARKLLAELGIPYRPTDPEALAKVALAARFASDPQLSALSDIRLILDETDLRGEAALRHAGGGKYLFDLALNGIDVDRYLPADAGAHEKSGGAEAAGAPLALLAGTTAEGRLAIGKLKAFGVQAQDVITKINARNGRVVLANTAKLYQGSLAGNTTVDASGKTPQLRFEAKLDKVQLGPLLKDANVFDNYSGTGNVTLDLTARGTEAAQLTRTLNGTAALDLRNGKIEGVDLQAIVRQAQTLLARARGSEVETAAGASDETTFDALTATIHVMDGAARNDDLKLTGPVVRASGAGTANLVKQALDYRLQVTLAEERGRQGTTFPVRVSGPFADLNYRVELGNLLREQLRERAKPLEEKLKQQVKPLEDKLQKGLKEELEQGLDRLRDRLKR